MSGSDYNAGYEDGVRNERQAQIYTNKKYGQEGYQEGLIKSISLISHLQQAIVPEKNVLIRDCIIDRRLQWKKLEEAIELIAEEIEANNNEY
jgi:hypothetical protein